MKDRVVYHNDDDGKATVLIYRGSDLVNPRILTFESFDEVSDFMEERHGKFWVGSDDINEKEHFGESANEYRKSNFKKDKHGSWVTKTILDN